MAACRMLRRNLLLRGRARPGGIVTLGRNLAALRGRARRAGLPGTAQRQVTGAAISGRLAARVRPGPVNGTGPASLSR